jgi:hypothetical protein
MVELGRLVQSRTPPALDTILAPVTAGIDMPLGALLVKHLGDLCGDADWWDMALVLYTRTQSMLSQSPDPAWREFLDSLLAMTAQSRSAAMQICEGASAAFGFLDSAMRGVDLRTDLLAVANATPDVLNAEVALKGICTPSYSYPALLLAPQLLVSHDLSTAFEHWTNRKYSEANRWFWAVLRREIALGSATYSRITKGHYARSVIDGLQEEIGRERVSGSFWLGVRLMIESGNPGIADQTTWTDSLVETYVDPECVSAAIELADRSPGATRERTLVALALFKRWTEVLPPHAEALARTMLQYAAASAKDGAWSLISDRNLSGSGFQVLIETARTRPEFRGLAAEAVVDAVIAKLTDRDFNAVSTAIETASAYLDAFDHRGLEAVVAAILDSLGRFGGGVGPWPVVRAALAFLSSSQVTMLCARDVALGTRVTSALLRFSLETETENTTLLFLLGNLAPALIEGQVDVERLEEVVSKIRRQSHEINSSAAPSNIMALLVAPAVVGIAGVRDAIESPA